jgi:hypothetical protein
MNHDELVEKMLVPFMAEFERPDKGFYAGMSAALCVAVEELLQNPTHEEIATQSGFGEHLRFLANRHSHYLKPKSAEERVTTYEGDLSFSFPFDVRLDGKWKLGFSLREDAETYLLGLIQQLKDGPK